jgi:hypothetical protein
MTHREQGDAVESGAGESGAVESDAVESDAVESGTEPSQQQHHNPETEEDTASGGAPEP